MKIFDRALECLPCVNMLLVYGTSFSLFPDVGKKHPIDAKIRTGRKQGVGWQRQATGVDERVGVREECSLFAPFSLSETHTHTRSVQ